MVVVVGFGRVVVVVRMTAAAFGLLRVTWVVVGRTAVVVVSSSNDTSRYCRSPPAVDASDRLARTPAGMTATTRLKAITSVVCSAADCRPLDCAASSLLARTRTGTSSMQQHNAAAATSRLPWATDSLRTSTLSVEGRAPSHAMCCGNGERPYAECPEDCKLAPPAKPNTVSAAAHVECSTSSTATLFTAAMAAPTSGT